MMSDGPGPDPRIGRQARLLRFLRVMVAVIGALAAVAVWAPKGVAAPTAWVVVALVVATPIVRVAWLTQRWFRKGDRRFALAGTALLAVIAAAFSVR